jgi:hypothetical protein
MIGLAVYLNRKKLTVAGAEDLSVLNAIVNAVGTLGTKARVDKRKGVSLFLSVGGLTGRSGGLEDEHLRWVEHQRLRVGDRVSVRVVRTNKANKPRSAHSAGGNMQKIVAKRLKKIGRQQTARTKPNAAHDSR